MMDSYSRWVFLDLLRVEVDLVRYFRVANGGFWPFVAFNPDTAPGVYSPLDVDSFVPIVEAVAEFNGFAHTRNRSEERAITAPNRPRK